MTFIGDANYTSRHTHPSVQAVYLVGSWDNFSIPYLMERDTRRDRGQWRGCHLFKDIVCDGDSGYTPSRDGGLKMGQTYYYYVSVLVISSVSNADIVR
jgi:hypothetical protein